MRRRPRTMDDPLYGGWLTSDPETVFGADRYGEWAIYYYTGLGEVAFSRLPQRRPPTKPVEVALKAEITLLKTEIARLKAALGDRTVTLNRVRRDKEDLAKRLREVTRAAAAADRQMMQEARKLAKQIATDKVKQRKKARTQSRRLSGTRVSSTTVLRNFFK